jgi:dGTPase
MLRFGDHFDHNQHALRIVESFEQRYARFPGLNLTFEVREGVVKHSRDFGPGEEPSLDAYLPGLRPVLEAQLIDLADEVAYNTADLDDAYAAGLFTAEEVAADVPQYADVFEAVETQFPGASSRERFHEGLRQLIDLLVSGLIDGTVAAAGESGAATADEVRACPGRLASFTPDVALTSRALKGFLLRKVYDTPALGGGRRHSQELISNLFQFFIENTARLPQPYADQALAEPAHRVVCDYIAGMTDAFLHRTYEQMLGPVSILPLS